MKIRVKFMSFLSNITETSGYMVQVPCKTVEDVLDHLFEQFPQLKQELFDSSGELDYIYQIVLNGNRVLYPADKQLPVAPGDELVFFAIVGGG
ncbi:MAG TPA: MoaD family protein [Desulfotomaculum sp.]|nr:MAG: hypothetical protein VR67_08260 [Peptococcaceae bacterium BRH_c8a]KJS70410.1 MAG: hypothetical protein JL56_16990 [Desulfotomaculum sp. BICA1-6]HBX22077.1 MoaD family protein [Desulfotomaculum sp.]